jgi:protein subunit release factor A
MMDGDYRVSLVEDRPSSGQWHCGPNAAWVTVTHLPTMISARAFDDSQSKARQTAMACCEMMVEASRLLKCQFPHSLLTPTPADEREKG